MVVSSSQFSCRQPNSIASFDYSLSHNIIINEWIIMYLIVYYYSPPNAFIALLIFAAIPTILAVVTAHTAILIP